MGCDKNVAWKGITPLMIAASETCIIESLILTCSCLHFSCKFIRCCSLFLLFKLFLTEKGSDDMVTALIHGGADFTIRLRNGSNALLMACKEGHWHCIRHIARAIEFRSEATFKLFYFILFYFVLCFSVNEFEFVQASVQLTQNLYFITFCQNWQLI
jgi:ankyrin repeat protein